MPTMILHLDINAAPSDVDLGRNERLLLIAWDGAAPVGMAEIPGVGGSVAGEEIERTARSFPPAADPLPVHDFPSVSVVVCTCRRPGELARCLEGIGGQARPPAEIVVIDNAPEDPATRQLLRERFPRCRYLAEERRGVSFARNRGVAEARGEIVAFLDDDCLPPAGWLEGIAAPFAAYPSLGCCTGPVLPDELETRAQELIERRGGFTRGFARQLFTPESGEVFGKNYPLQGWIFGSGGSMAFRAEALKVLGGFDEILPTAEDIEIFSRVIRGGYSLLYEPAAAVLHRHLRDGSSLRRRLHLWGAGYMSQLAKVALDDPVYRRRALAEMAGWLKYQIRARLVGPEGKDFPTGFILAEISGGILGAPGYLWKRGKGRGAPGNNIPGFRPGTFNR